MTGSSGTYWDGQRVSESNASNASNPVAVCDVQVAQQVTETKDGSSTQRLYARHGFEDAHLSAPTDPSVTMLKTLVAPSPSQEGGSPHIP